MTPYNVAPRRPSQTPGASAPGRTPNDRPPSWGSTSIPTTERLLRAAEEEFAAHGFQNARLTEISAHAGMSRSSLMYHFESKQALYAAVIRHAMLRLDEALSLATQGRDGPAARVLRGVEAYASFMESRPSLARLAVREVLGRGGNEPALLLDSGLVLLERFEVLLAPHASRGFPAREALVQIATGVILRVAGGDTGELAERTVRAAELTFGEVLADEAQATLPKASS